MRDCDQLESRQAGTLPYHINQDAVKKTGMREFTNSRILIGFTRTGSIPLKIIDEGCSIVSEITKVDRFSTLPQQQQPAENLEKIRQKADRCCIIINGAM